MMKDKDVKELISDLDKLILAGVNTAKAEEKKFSDLMDYVYNDGNVDFTTFDNSISKLENEIKDAKRLLEYGDEAQRAKIETRQATIARLKQMKEKINGLKEKAIDIEIEKTTENFDIADYKEVEEEKIKSQNDEIQNNKTKIKELDTISDDIDEKAGFKKYLEAAFMEQATNEYNKIIQDISDENAKPDNEKDIQKIEELKKQLEIAKKKINKCNFKDHLGEKNANDIAKELAAGKKISKTDILANFSQKKADVKYDVILNSIKTSPEVSEKFKAIYAKRKGIEPKDVKINDLKASDIDIKDIIAIRKSIFVERNELDAKNRVITKEIDEKNKTINKINQLGILKETNKSDAELWRNYATGEQKNQIALYRDNFGDRFRFWRSEQKNIFSAFFRSFNKNKTISVARRSQVANLKTQAENAKKTWKNKFKESLKAHVKDNDIKVKEANIREVYRNMDRDEK